MAIGSVANPFLLTSIPCPVTSLITRRQARWTFCAGHFMIYGQDRMWRRSPGWIDTLGPPAACRMQVFRLIIAPLSWWTYSPDLGLVGAGRGDEKTFVTGLMAKDRRQGLV